MQVALNNVFSKEDEAVVKLIDTVVRLVRENMPMSKFESLLDHLVSIKVPGLEFLVCSERINYKSYYSANELLTSVSDYIDNDMNCIARVSMPLCSC